MPELMRSIANRLREMVGNRRRAPRHPARIVAVVSLAGAKTSTRTPSNLPTIAGHTRDISVTGLALIFPAIRIGGRYLTGEDQLLHVTLKLPTGAVQLQAAPVRYEHLDEGDDDTGYLIGVSIKEMSDRDRTLFTEYLRTMRKGGGHSTAD
jgi:hypothetical protein